MICAVCHAPLPAGLPATFLSTFSSKVLFFSVSLLIGSTLPNQLSALGVPMQGSWRLVIDLAIGAGYYFVCRWGYARWRLLRDQ